MRKGVNQRAHSSRGVRPPDLPITLANLYVLRGDNAPERTAEYRLCYFELCHFKCFLEGLWHGNCFFRLNVFISVGLLDLSKAVVNMYILVLIIVHDFKFNQDFS